MKKGLIGKKLGMTQIFGENGKVIPVTVIDVTSNKVVQIKTNEVDGYASIQLGFGEVKEKQLIKPKKGHFDKFKIDYKKHLREFRLDDVTGYEVGQELNADVFKEGDIVDIQGTTKGKGFQGVMGSSATPSRVFKGKKLPGHMGNVTATVQNLTVVKVDTEKNVILVKGSVPGPKGTIVKVKG